MHKNILLPQFDNLDRRILAILQQDNTTPQRTIGETVNLSAPAVQRRIKRMSDEGVIRANVAIIDPMAVGQSITIFVEVEVVLVNCARSILPRMPQEYSSMVLVQAMCRAQSVGMLRPMSSRS